MALLKTSEDQYEVGDICTVLINIGTDDSIPILLEKVHHQNKWIRSSVMETLVHLGNSKVIPVFIAGLKDRFYVSKHHALIGICKLGDENFIDLVYKNVNKILSYNRILDADHLNKTTDLIQGITFLHKYIKGTEKMEKLIRKIENKWNVLSDHERAFLQSNYN